MRRLMLAILLGFFSGTYAQSIRTVEEAVALALRHNYDILLVRNDSAAFALEVCSCSLIRELVELFL